MKKVLIFSLAYYPDHVAGAEVAIREITKRLGHEYQFDLITLSCGRGGGCCKSKEFIDGVRVYRIGSWIGGLSELFAKIFGRPKISAGNFRVISKAAYPLLAALYGFSLQGRQYDIVWSMMAAHAGLAGLIFKTFNPRVKFLLSLQEGLSAEEMKRIAKPIWPLFRQIFMKADDIQALSRYLADFAEHDIGVTKPVTIVPNGVDFDKFANVQETDRDKMREKYGFTKNDFVLVTTSRLATKNGVGDVIDAFVQPEMPAAVKFLIVGQGSLESGLRSKVEKLGLSNRVIFAGFVENDDLPKLLHSCDAFTRPSLSEGFGISFIEAMAAGLPVIATQVGGIADFLTDPSQDNSSDGSLATGLACLPHNPASVALAIGKIYTDRALANRLVLNARQMVKNRYDWNTVVQGMSRVFASLSARSNAIIV